MSNEITLGHDEHIVRNYPYRSIAVKKASVESSLMLTNKRLISTTTTRIDHNSTLEISDLPISHIDTLDYGFFYRRRIPILLLIFLSLMVITGIVFSFILDDGEQLEQIGYILMGVGTLGIILVLLLCKKDYVFNLDVGTLTRARSGVNEHIAFGMSNLKAAKKKRGRKAKKHSALMTRLATEGLNKQVVDAITSELGSLVLLLKK